MLMWSIKVTCNLVTLLLCSYLVTLKVGKIYVPIHDVRTAVAVLSVAPISCEDARHWDTLIKECLWNLKNIILEIRTRTHLEVVNKLEHSEPLRNCKFGNGISRFPGVLSTVLCVSQCISRNERVRDGKQFKIVIKCWICITRGLPIFPQFFIVSLTLH